jgi:FKBP-type peptidyl-prolyl cis-trans isomerase 2
MVAKTGDTVRVHYTGRLVDGDIFDSSTDRDPLEFILGKEQVIKGFENAIIGMAVGERRTAEIPSDDAYGNYRGELVTELDRENLPNDIEPEIGVQLQVAGETGECVIMRIIGVSEKNITLDANHPLAGQDLIFDIELVEIL